MYRYTVKKKLGKTFQRVAACAVAAYTLSYCTAVEFMCVVFGDSITFIVVNAMTMEV